MGLIAPHVVVVAPSPEPARVQICMKKETRLGRGGRGWRIHHGFIHQFLNLMFLESVHELSGLARSAELVGLFCFVYVYLADRQYSRSRNGTDY